MMMMKTIREIIENSPKQTPTHKQLQKLYEYDLGLNSISLSHIYNKHTTTYIHTHTQLKETRTKIRKKKK